MTIMGWQLHLSCTAKPWGGSDPPIPGGYQVKESWQPWEVAAEPSSQRGCLCPVPEVFLLPRSSPAFLEREKRPGSRVEP